MTHPPAPETTYQFLARAIEGSDAGAFVHVGDRFDPAMRYLTRFEGPDSAYAFVYVDGTAILCAPRLFGEQADREFAGDEVETHSPDADRSPAERATAVLERHDAVGTVLAPPGMASVHHGTLEEAGVAPLATDAVESRRERKTPDELACIAAVERAAGAGMAAGETLLAGGTVDDDRVVVDGEPLTTERLRREVNAALARAGVTDARNTVVGAGPTCTDLHFTGDVPIRPDQPVVVDVSPRGPNGYYGDFTRTFVVGDPAPRVARAYKAVRAAQDAVFDLLASGSGVEAERVHRTAAETLASYGFATGDGETGFYHNVGHGVGLSLHERPTLRGTTTLRPGRVVTVEPGVYDPDWGGVRLETLVVVGSDGFRDLAEYPRAIAPSDRGDGATADGG